MSDTSPTIAPRKRRRRWWLWTAIVSPLWLPLLFYGCVRLAHPNAGPGKIRVSRETTFFTEPLDADGFVDYVEALNGELSAGVTRENNAAVLYWQSGAVARVGDPEYLDVIASALGVESYQERNDAYVALYAFVHKRPELRRNFPPGNELLDVSISPDEATPQIHKTLLPLLVAEDWPAVHDLLIRHRHHLLGAHTDDDPTWPAHQFGQRYPWTEADYPEAAAWLKHSEPALQLLAEASRRPRYFSPLAGGDEPPYLPSALLPDLNSMVEVSRAFAMRAMLRMGEGDVEGAWVDVLVIHRWARLAAQNPTIVGQLVADTIEGKAIDLEECLFASHKPSREQLENMLTEFRALPAFPPAASILDRLERCMLLECIQAAARRGSANILFAHSVFDGFDVEPTPGYGWWINQIVDWNNILMEANAHFDSGVAALRQDSYAKKQAACDQLEADVHQLVRDAHSPTNFCSSFVRGSAMERRLAAAYIALFMRSYSAIMVAEERIRMRQTLAETALLLAFYRADHGEFPDALDALIPKYCEKLPADRFDGQPICYRRSERGFVVYSIGENLRDDGGTPPGAWQIRGRGSNNFDVVFEAPPLIQPE